MNLHDSEVIRPVRLSVGLWVGQSFIISKNGGRFNFHASIGALVQFCGHLSEVKKKFIRIPIRNTNMENL